MQPPFECEVCGTRFAKATKRDVHLLDVHGARFGLSPRALSPSADPSVGHVVRRAIAEANIAFATTSIGSAACASCPISTTTFKNPRDLAQHILSKHTDDNLLDDVSAVSQMPPPAKRSKLLCVDITDAESTPQPIVKTEEKPAPSARKPPVSPKSNDNSSESNSSPRKNKLDHIQPRKEQTCSMATVADDRPSVAMDFAAIIGFTTNAHKSYYRLSKR